MPTPEELEDAAADEATRGLRQRLRDLGLKAQHLARTAESEDDWRYLAERLADHLETTDTSDITPALARHTGEAVEHGVTEARTRLQLQTPRRRVMAPMDVIRAAMNAPDKAAEELRAAGRLMRAARSSADLQAALARAQRSVTRTEAAARWSVNRSLSEGTRAVTEEAGAGRLWVPERDACLHCLAYAGLYVGPGEAFPAELTYAEHPLKAGPIPDPPLHPNCRCRTIPHRAEWGSDYGDALKREAERSVARGFSLPSESENRRLAAADRLLKRGSTLPKSVQDYARTSVRRGRFSRGRAVPSPSRQEPRRELNPSPLPRLTPRRDDGTSRRTAARTKPRESMPTPPPVPRDPLADVPRQRPYNEAKLRALMERTGRSRESIIRSADTKAINPNYRLGQEWQVNCQRVSVAYEMRRRGLDVVALPNRKGIDKQYTLTDLRELWQPPEGQTSKRTFSVYGTNHRQLDAQVNTWPPGARGWIVSHWKAGGGHIWNVEVDADGQVHYIDAQIGRELPGGEPHFSDARELFLMRVDDLVPTEEQVGMVKPRAR